MQVQIPLTSFQRLSFRIPFREDDNVKPFRSVLITVFIASLILVVLSTSPQSILWRIENTTRHVVGNLDYYYKVSITTIQGQIANCKGFLEKRNNQDFEDFSFTRLPENLYSYFKNTIVL